MIYFITSVSQLNILLVPFLQLSPVLHARAHSFWYPPLFCKYVFVWMPPRYLWGPPERGVYTTAGELRKGYPTDWKGVSQGLERGIPRIGKLRFVVMFFQFTHKTIFNQVGINSANFIICY